MFFIKQAQRYLQHIQILNLMQLSENLFRKNQWSRQNNNFHNFHDFHFIHCITIDKKIHTTGTRRWRRWSACFYSNEAGAHHQKEQKRFQHFQTPCPPVISLIDLILVRLLENNCTICSYSHMSMSYLTSLGTNQILLIKKQRGGKLVSSFFFKSQVVPLKV